MMRLRPDVQFVVLTKRGRRMASIVSELAPRHVEQFMPYRSKTSRAPGCSSSAAMMAMSLSKMVTLPVVATARRMCGPFALPKRV